MKLLTWVFAALIVLGGPAYAQERITAAGGISIEKPRGWTIMPPDRAVANLRGLTFDSPDFRRVVDTSRAPFLTLIKYPADHEGINPTIKVNYQALPDSMRGIGPVELLGGVVDSMRGNFPDLEVLDTPRLVQFTGTPGAHVRIAYTLKGKSGAPFQAISELWVSVRGGYAIILGVGYASDEPAGTVIEIDRVAKSFEVDDTGPRPDMLPPNQPNASR